MTNLSTWISFLEAVFEPLPDSAIRSLVDQTFPEFRHISNASSQEEVRIAVHRLEWRLKAELETVEPS